MKRFLLRWLIHTITLLLVAQFVSGIIIERWTAALVAALVLGVLNAVLKPLIILVTLPINILSLGLFTLFINAFMLYFVAHVVRGFTVVDFWSAFWGALLFSIFSLIFNSVLGSAGDEARFRFIRREPPAPPPQDRGKVIDAEVVEEPKNDRDKKREQKKLQ
jgi:putative membrane protein